MFTESKQWNFYLSNIFNIRNGGLLIWIRHSKFYILLEKPQRIQWHLVASSSMDYSRYKLN